MSYLYSLGENNEIIDSRGCVIEEPAIMFDKETGTLHAHGNKADVKNVYNKFKLADVEGTIVKDLVMIVWDVDLVDADNIVETMNKCIETCDYAKVLYQSVCGKNK